jgi:hypothetical protein
MPSLTIRPRTLALLTTAAVCGFAIAADPPKGKVEGYTDTPLIPGSKWHIHDPNRPQPPVVTPGETFSHLAPPPSDAVVLFDGKDLAKWVGEKGNAPEWKVADGYTEATKGKIRTRDEFGDFQLHLEFATPAKVEGKGQGRGNNGVNIFGRYEIQILDSFENPTYPDGMVGAIYGQRPPLANASKKPGEWQTYDIIFESPRWDDAKKLAKKAYVTVLHNGVLLHHRQELIGHTPFRAASNYDRPHPPKGFIELYYHSNPVRFRNVWIRPVAERTSD